MLNKEPSPYYPKEIKNESYVPINVNGKEMFFPLKEAEKIKYAFIEDNILYITYTNGKKYKLELED